MCRLAWPALLLALAACGTSDDDRPRDAQYITDTILAPTCGGAQCHSTFAQTNDVVLDTYSAMRNTMVNFPLLSFSADQYDPADPDDSALITWVTQIDPFGLGIGRMPYDAPMPNADVDLLKAWITGPIDKRDDDAACTPGVTACPALDDTCVVPTGDTAGECFEITYPQPALGAECDPSQSNHLACNGTNLVMCGDDWNFGALVQVCDNDCILGVCS
jgi:hypothetical protein